MGKQKTVYMTEDQMIQILDIQGVTGESVSTIIRKGIGLYLIKVTGGKND